MRGFRALFAPVRFAGTFTIGVGARGTLNVVPPSLRESYSSRLPLGVAVYLGMRPGMISPMPGAASTPSISSLSCPSQN